VCQSVSRGILIRLLTVFFLQFSVIYTISALLHMNQKSEVFVYEKFLSEEGLRAAPEHLFIREVRILAIS